MSVGENLKHVVSISLGSSTRDSSVRLRLGEWDVLIERIGTDGNLKKAAAMLEQWDGKADAIGLGGTDLYVYVGEKGIRCGSQQRLLPMFAERRCWTAAA